MLFRLSGIFLLARYASTTALTLWMLTTISAAYAHLMPAQQGSINLLDNAAFVVLSLPVSGLKKFDENIDANHDGRLSEGELQLRRANIEQYVKQRFRLFEGADAGTVDFIQISTEQDEQDELANTKAQIFPIVRGATHVLVLMKISFKTAPKALRIEFDLFGALENEKQVAIKATRGKEVEAIILRQSHPQHHFFRSSWHVLMDYTITGAEHILMGFDHLLFLLTIIVAAAGWRYWLSILTCFTLAHSITLTMALSGWLRAPANIVEPLIALSIIIMAALNLTRHHTARRSRLLIVFGCGLLHGMGFASSIADMGLHGTYRLMSVLGFNLGIELGQAIFLMGVLALSGALPYLRNIPKLNRLDLTGVAKPIASSFALVAGAFWMLERLTVF